MNIAVINIRDLIKCVVILCVFVIIIVVGIKVVKGKEEFESTEVLSEMENSSFLYCLEMELPLISSDKSEETKEENTLSSGYQILNTGLAMLYSINDAEELEQELIEELANQQEQVEPIEENIDKTISEGESFATRIISENNIEASFTNSENDIQVKNQSTYDINDLIKSTNYELKNKEKIIIYHTHTCESYTSSDKYSYEMTGSYRTTDLNYTVARVRR